MPAFLSRLLILLLFCQCTSHSEQKNQSPEPNRTPEKITQWRGPNRDGIYPETGLLTRWPEGGPRLVWRFDSLGVGYASPLVTEDKIYTIGTHNKTSAVFAFDPNGALLWTCPLGPEWVRNYPGSRGTPLIVDSLGYYFSGLGVLYCFHAERGELIWQRELKKSCGGRHRNCGFSENLVAHGDKVFCTPGGVDTNVVALNRFNGDWVWTSPGAGEGSVYTNPILIERGGRTFFVTQTAHTAFALDAETGALAWSHATDEKTQANTPYYRNGELLFIGDFKGNSILLQVSEGGDAVEEIWRTRDLSAEQGDVVVLGDLIYGANSEQREFVCIDWNSGRKLYRTSRPAPMYITLISAEGLLYAYDTDGTFSLYNPSANGFELRGRFQVEDRIKRKRPLHYSHPVIHEGRLYIRHDGMLLVYQIGVD